MTSLGAKRAMLDLQPQRAQVTHVRPLHLESARSYLQRLCEANRTDFSYVLDLITKRKRASTLLGKTRPHEMAVLIEELGGPGLGHWLRAWSMSQPSVVNPAEVRAGLPFERQRDARRICDYCAAGTGAMSYSHYNSYVCLKHARWTYPDGGSSRQCQVFDPAAWRRVERRYRNVIRSPRISRDVVEDVWGLVRDNTSMLDVQAWADIVDRVMHRPGSQRGVDDRMALYPQTVRVLEVLADESLWPYTPVRWVDADDFRTLLRRQFAWVPGDNWVLVEGAAEIMKRDRRLARSA